MATRLQYCRAGPAQDLLRERRSLMLKNLFSSATHAQAAAPAPAPPAYAYPLKLNLGCGYKKLDGYVNADKYPDSQPDLLLDLEVLPWPFPDNSVTHIMMSNILEHIGQQPALFLRIVQELWRICAPQAEITISVPHPRHDHFLGDPTHVRAILPDTLHVFDQVQNRNGIATGNATTPLGVQLGVDFHVDSVQFVLDPRWLPRFESGEVTAEQVMEYSLKENNVIAEFIFRWIVHKPVRG